MPNMFDRKETLLIGSFSKPYPDTGESGETYDVEFVAGSCSRGERLGIRTE
jgi:hypothetical protein